MIKRTFIPALAIMLCTMAGVVACSNENQQSLPEPVTNHYLTGSVVFTEPDGFRNVSFGCNGHVGVYVTSRGAYKTSGQDIASLPSGVAVLANDPNCP